MTVAQLEADTQAWIESLGLPTATPGAARIARLAGDAALPIADADLDAIRLRWGGGQACGDAPRTTLDALHVLTQARGDLARLLAEVERLRDLDRQAVALTLRVGEAEALADVARYVGGLVEELIASAVVEEREACAEVAETTGTGLAPGIRKHPAALRADIAAAIRARV